MKKLLAIILSIVLAVTGALSQAAGVQALDRIEVTFCTSSVEPGYQAKEFTITAGAGDDTIGDLMEAVSSLESELLDDDHIFGRGNGYRVSLSPMSSFASWKDFDEREGSSTIDSTPYEDTRVYVFVSKLIEPFDVTVPVPQPGDDVQMDIENVSIESGVKASLNGPFWQNVGGGAYQGGTVERGDELMACVALVPEYGYVFKETLPADGAWGEEKQSYITINGEAADNWGIWAGEAEISRDFTVDYPKLPDPANLKWSEGEYPTTGEWEWDIDDYFTYWAGFNATVYWELDGETAQRNGPAFENYKDFNVDTGGGNDFFNHQGEGYYWFDVKAIAEESPDLFPKYSDSNRVTSDKTYFYDYHFDMVALDAQGEETDEAGGKLLRMRDDDTFSSIQDEERHFIPAGRTYRLKAEPDRSYVFVKYIVDTEEISDPEITLEINKSRTVKALFQYDPSTADIIVDFGKEHQEFAQKVCDLFIENSIGTAQTVDENGVMSFKWPKASIMEAEPAEVIQSVVMMMGTTSMYEPPKAVEDGGEYLDAYRYAFGFEPLSAYSSEEDLEKEIKQRQETPLSDRLELVALWKKPATMADFEAEPIYCGTKIEVIKHEESQGDDQLVRIWYEQKPLPEIAASEESHFEPAEDDAFRTVLLKEKPELPESMADYEAWYRLLDHLNDADNWYSGTVEAGDVLYLVMPGQVRFGYVANEDTAVTVTVNGETIKASDVAVLGEAGVLAIYELKADHKWTDPEYVWADDNSTVTASRYCENEEGLIEKETVKVNAKITPATCEKEGKETYTSAKFENEAFEVQIKEITHEALGHDWSKWKTVTEPTCTDKGEEERICNNDPSHKETNELAPTGHDWSDWEIIKEPTATEKGLKQRTCKNDPTHKETEEIPPTGEEETTTFYITFDLNGGTLDGLTGKITYLCEEGSTIILPEPSRDNYDFDYWEGSKYYAGESYTVTEDHDFKAIWKEARKEQKPSSYTAPKTGVE